MGANVSITGPLVDVRCPIHAVMLTNARPNTGSTERPRLPCQAPVPVVDVLLGSDAASGPRPVGAVAPASSAIPGQPGRSPAMSTSQRALAETSPRPPPQPETGPALRAVCTNGSCSENCQCRPNRLA